MIKTDTSYYQSEIRRWLEAAAHYTAALEGNVFVLAGTFSRYAKALNETEALENVSVTGPNGAMQQHPAFKMQRECEESILKQLKELGLTATGTRGKVERDPAVELIEEVTGRTRRRKIIKPDV